MEKRWRLKQWDEKLLDHAQTIMGKNFELLMTLCFNYADCFSLSRKDGLLAKDSELEQALESYKIKEIATDRWFCHLPPERVSFEVSPMEICLYPASDETRQILLQYVDSLFFEKDASAYSHTLADLCLFRENELFFGTVSHEKLCSVKELSGRFSEQLFKLGDWEKSEEDPLERLSLTEFL